MLSGTKATKVIFDEVYELEISKGYDLVTDELMDNARNMLSSALPEDASETVIGAFWSKVYERL